MNSTLLAALLASAVAAPAPAEEMPKPPQGLPPTQVIINMTKDGEFEITQTRLVPEERTETRTRNINGTPVLETGKVIVHVPVQVKFRIKGEGVKVYTAAGKEVDAKEVPEKLKKPTIVLFAADGNKVDPFYLKLLKPEALVVVAPAPSATTTPAPGT